MHWAKFPPLGRRGCDAAGADAPYLALPIDEYTTRANENTSVIIQIETPAALENVEAIAAVDGVDILMLGPGDLSLQLGIPGQIDHQLIREASERTAKAARNAGKHWGRPVGSRQQAEQMMEMGARFICHSADILIVKAAFESIQQDFAKSGFTFHNRLC